MSSDNLDIRDLKMIFSKSGYGSPTTKMSIPISWCYNMGLEKDNRSVVAIYDFDKKEIIIRKK